MGAIWNQRGIGSRLSPEESLEHINVLELRSVYLALQHFLPALGDRHVLIPSDNTSTVFHLYHQGSTHIFTANSQLTASIRAVHLSGQSSGGCSVQGSATSGVMEASPRCSAVNLSVIWEGRGGSVCVRTDHPLQLVVCENRDVQPRTGCMPMSGHIACCMHSLLFHCYGRQYTEIFLFKHRVLLVAPWWPARPWFPLFWIFCRTNLGSSSSEGISSLSWACRFGIWIWIWIWIFSSHFISTEYATTSIRRQRSAFYLKRVCCCHICSSCYSWWFFFGIS